MEERSTAVIIIAAHLIANKTGCMVEEWRQSAPSTAKCMMLQQWMREAACTARENKSSQAYIHGQEGIGQLGALTTIVVSAQNSGYFVLYMRLQIKSNMDVGSRVWYTKWHRIFTYMIVFRSKI